MSNKKHNPNEIPGIISKNVDEYFDATKIELAISTNSGELIDTYPEIRYIEINTKDEIFKFYINFLEITSDILNKYNHVNKGDIISIKYIKSNQSIEEYKYKIIEKGGVNHEELWICPLVERIY